MAVVLATGFFDGVHTGHRLVIRELVRSANERGVESVVVTFWPHPRNVLQDDARNLRLLTSLEEKKLQISALGVDWIEVLTFSRDFSQHTTAEYLRDIVRGRFGASAIVLGYDNRIGNDNLSTLETAAIARSLGMEVIHVPRGLDVSSTKIRTALSEGRVEDANAMLGYSYSLHGVVVAGNRLGRTIGFPTANMQLYEPLKLIPCDGVYAVEVETLGKRFKGMCNIGVRPTVSSGEYRTVETHIFDFEEDIYGLDIRLSFIRKIRDERPFPSLEALRQQLSQDRQEIIRIFDR
ncbi:MAG: riboflavin biosynthesis protein RibF [Bacteroidales bacterium]|nr:riboflavin biosynthesis protein RibF [Bacteroidales bacterium]